jgi:hypothetical protein
MALDVIANFVLPNPAFALDSHLAIANGGQPTYTFFDGETIWLIKSAQGYPYDTLTFDANLVYQSITNPGGVWDNPAAFKMFASTSRTTGNGGIAWMPRMMNEGADNSPIVTADSTYRTYTSCTQFTTANLGGPTLVTLQGPYPLSSAIPAFGSAIPSTTPVIIQSYYWGVGYSTREMNYYAQGYSLIQWQTQSLANGIYVPGQTSLFNTLVNGGAPKLVCPCGVPTI